MLNLLFFTSFLYSHNLIERFRNTLLKSGYVSNEKYIIVIDAGSTGTRLHIYGFLKPGNIISYHSTIKLTPGLHTLKKKKTIKKYLKKLLEKGRMGLSEKGVNIREVPIVLLGTAGMRSLDVKGKIKMVKLVERIFKKFRLKIFQVDIISGFEEGILALQSLKLLIEYNNNIVYKFGCADTELNKYLNNISNGFCDMKANRKKYHGIIDMGGGSVQLAYEFPSYDPYNDPKHVIYSIDKNIYLNFFPGWGLNEGIKVLKINQKYTLEDENGKKITMFDKLLDDFKYNDKPDINKVDDLYLLSYFYDKFMKLGCQTKTNLVEIKNKIDKKCGDKNISYRIGSDKKKENCNEDGEICDEVYYMYKFLMAQGIDRNKMLYLVSDIDGIDLNWSFSKGIMMLNQK